LEIEGRQPGLLQGFASAGGPLVLSRDRLLAFRPDAMRGRALYQEVKRRVADSLREVAAASRSVVEFDEVRLGSFLDNAVRAEHVSARLFGIYYDLLSAIDRDDIDAVSGLFAELLESGCACGAVAYRNFTDQDLGSGNAARYERSIDTDPKNPLRLSPIDRSEFERIIRVANEGFALLDAGAPEVAGEIRALVAEIVFAMGKPGEQVVFHGVSSFLLWGALFFNAQGHRTALDVIQTLAHESCHLHLFGVAVDGPLVLNPDEERHPSPLRHDPRPMDGVYHATYVTARMHYAVARLLESGVLDAAQRQQAEADLRDHSETFRKGVATIEAHGRLTELGSALLSKAREYMVGGPT
jgi:hypothetical protein